MENKNSAKIDKQLIQKALKASQQDRFLLIYPYLNRILGSLRKKKFRSVSRFDWDDLCAKVYQDVFVLSASKEWLKYAPQQVKRFLYVVSTNCMLGEIKRVQEEGVQIDEKNIQDDTVESDQVEKNAYRIEEQLTERYSRLLGREIVDEKYRKIVSRYSKIIAKQITESN